MIGIDILEIERIKDKLAKPGFMSNVFTYYELQYFIVKGRSVETLAGIFSAKESFGKALGTGISGFRLTDVEIRHSEAGQPFYKLYNNAKTLLSERFAHLSISHSKDNVVSVCILLSNCA